MQRKIIICLSVTCLLLAILSSYLAFRLYSQSRFTTTQSTNPYIMFDKKTAQACWSGPSSPGPAQPASSGRGSLPDGFVIAGGSADVPEMSAAGIPFCKDLK
jgi:hypothetical protein